MKFARLAVPIPLHPFDRLLDYSIPHELQDQVQAGSLVEINFRNRKSWGMVFGCSNESEVEEKKIKALNRLIYPEPILDEKRRDFAHWMSRKYFFPIGEVVESMIPASVRKASKKLLEKKSPPKKKPPPPESLPRLSLAQQEACTNCSGSGVHLLWGVTGSGKTRVYIELIREKLEAGNSAILLLPEISLTPQILERFESAFPDNVAVFHSQQTPAKLRQAWVDVFTERKKIALGARSALWAPAQNLGIVIIDEEHDSSYKQEERLKYHAREAAEELARSMSIPLVLGSATPSAETLFRAEKKDYSCSFLPERAVENAQLPQVQIIDLKKQIAEKDFNPENLALHLMKKEEQPDGFLEHPGSEFLFVTPQLKEELMNCLDREEQSILFLNRRGLGSQVLCRSCGFIMECPSCHVKLSPHKEKVLCHYCGYSQKVLSQCPECNAEHSFSELGVGTEAVEEYLKKELPGARLLRMDRDSIEKQSDLEETVEAFRNKKADILIGTQMVAKGHDFPNVTLVGVLFADLGLGVADFRAYERNFQLLLQVSGRAGRASGGAKVLLQCFNPEHPVFQALQNYKKLEDYRDFILNDLEARKDLLYPPFGDLVLLRLDSLNEKDVRDAAALVAQALRKIDSEELFVLGPVPAPIFKIRNRYRWQVLLKSSNSKLLGKSIDWLWERWKLGRLEQQYNSRLMIDSYPVQML